MNRLALGTCCLLGALSLGAGSVQAASEAECAQIWASLDTDQDGFIDENMSERYLAWLRVNEVELPADGRIDQALYLESCQEDRFVEQEPDADAPLAGANSFTEGQARDRILAYGYSDVSELRKDDDGIWRGTALLDGQSVAVAVDYKGNVVAN